MVGGNVMTLRQILEGQLEYSQNDCLFIERGPIKFDSLCLVDPADLYDVDYIPPLAQENSMKYLIMMDSYDDIMSNLRFQIKNPTIDQKFEALKFYVDNDAFKIWQSSEP